MGERGSATVIVLGMMVALVTTFVVTFGLASQVLLSHRLQGAADRAALAASDVLIGRNGELPCLSAEELLRRSGFDLVSCDLGPTSARVVAAAHLHGLTLTRRAHAGVANSGQK